LSEATSSPARRVVGVVQARTTSSRLPGKVLQPVLGQPMLTRHVERLRRCRTLDSLVIATSDDASDDPVAELARTLGVEVHRGPLDDVLARFAGAARRFCPEGHVVRLTADCPLADPQVIDRLVRLHLDSGGDYASAALPTRTIPEGLDCEVFTAAALFAADEEADTPYDREHVTPFINTRPDRFRQTPFVMSPSLAHLRWTVDLPRDLDFVRYVYESLHPEKPDFVTADILALDRISS
jgi:spore coat polysaccharide biosynthesis protein SpsF